jgi:hypothetical protein
MVKLTIKVGKELEGPLGAGTDSEGFIEDYAVVELDSSKIEEAYMGHVIDLGTFWSISLRPSNLTVISRHGNSDLQVHNEDVPSHRRPHDLEVSGW